MTKKTRTQLAQEVWAAHQDSPEVAVDAAREFLRIVLADQDAAQALQTDLVQQTVQAIAALEDKPTEDSVHKVIDTVLADQDAAQALQTLDEGQPFQAAPIPDHEPPARKWLVPGMLPAGRLASLYGQGAAGKSLLALQLAAAVMAGGPAFEGALTPQPKDKLIPACNAGKPGKVLWLTWEDEVAEIWRRWWMLERAGAIPRGLDKTQLTVVDMRADDGGALWAPLGQGHVSTLAGWTSAGRRFLATMPGHALAILDPLAAAFASNENDRSLVRAFAAALDGASERNECATLLVAHPPKSEGSGGYSGSTDWRNAVRAMWQIEKQPTGYKSKDGKLVEERGKDEIKAWQLCNDKQSYAARSGKFWMHRHWQAPTYGGAGAELGWRFKATDKQAAEAQAGLLGSGGDLDDAEGF